MTSESSTISQDKQKQKQISISLGEAKPSSGIHAMSSEPPGLYKNVVTHLNDLGPWANLFGVITFLLLLFSGIKYIWKKFFSQKTPESIETWVKQRLRQSEERINPTCRKRVKIAVVDDQPIDISANTLITLGYKVHIFTSMSLAEAEKLSEFDLVILDIANVVPEDPSRGGLSIIRKLKEFSTPPIVIAVSGKRYDPSLTEFFKLADLQLKKPITAEKLEEATENLLRPRFSILGIAKSLDAEIAGNGVPKAEILRLNRIIVQVLNGKNKKRPQLVDERKRDNRLWIDIDRLLTAKISNGY